MAELILKLGDCTLRSYPFDGGEVSIGRGEDNELVIARLDVSRHHARIVQRQGGLYLIDLNSAGGVCVNATPVRLARLYDQDIIAVAAHRIVVNAPLQPQPGRQGDAGDPHESAESDASGAALTFLSLNRRNPLHPLKGKVTRIGRSRDGNLRLTDWFVEDRQAMIRREATGFRLRNLGEPQRVRVNGVAVRQAMLRDGDVVEIGATPMRFSLQGDASPESENLRVPEEPSAEELAVLGLTGLGAGPSAAEAPAWNWPDDEPGEPEQAEILEPLPVLLEKTWEELPEPVAEGTTDEPVDTLPPEPESVPDVLAAASAKTRDATPGVIATWERALRNKSLAVRKQAALQLGRLTGRRYEP